MKSIASQLFQSVRDNIDRIALFQGVMVLPAIPFVFLENLHRRWDVWAMVALWAVIWFIVASTMESENPAIKKWSGRIIASLVIVAIILPAFAI